MNSFTDFVNRKTREYGPRFDVSGLEKRFLPYYQSGERIRVETCGMVLTGTVSVTTGWRPSFLLMQRSNSIGSPWTLGPNDKILAVKRGKHYVAVQS